MSRRPLGRLRDGEARDETAQNASSTTTDGWKTIKPSGWTLVAALSVAAVATAQRQIVAVQGSKRAPQTARHAAAVIRATCQTT